MNNEDIYKSVLVLGNGTFSSRVGHEIASLGYPVTIAVSSEAVPVEPGTGGTDLEVWAPAKLMDFSGQPGNFKAAFDTKGGEVRQGSFGCVVVAMECLWRSAVDKWAGADTQGIVGLSRFLEISNSQAEGFGRGDRVVFICGFKHNSWPASQEKVVREAVRLRQSKGLEVYVLTEHFKVAAPGMERLIRNARGAGVMFVKSSNSSPEVMVQEGQVVVKYFDEAWGRHVKVSPKLTIVEDEACPPQEALLVSKTLGIKTDSNGFLQGDFIFNVPMFTNRTGIFVVGSGKGPISNAQEDAEVEAVAFEVSKLLAHIEESPKGPFAILDERKCGQCLTCFRICPHRAISLYYEKSKPQISPLACRGCGICVAACPMEAIDLQGYERDGVSAELEGAIEALCAGGADKHPSLLVLACQNSAYDAYLLAKGTGSSINKGIEVFKVPCGGRVDLEQIVRPLHAGVDGVMVLACHHDSCKSVYGSNTCEQRVRMLGDMLEQVGIDKGRISFATVAPGAGPELASLVEDFRSRLGTAGSEMDDRANP